MKSLKKFILTLGPIFLSSQFAHAGVIYCKNEQAAGKTDEFFIVTENRETCIFLYKSEHSNKYYSKDFKCFEPSEDERSSGNFLKCTNREGFPYYLQELLFSFANGINNTQGINGVYITDSLFPVGPNPHTVDLICSETPT